MISFLKIKTNAACCGKGMEHSDMDSNRKSVIKTFSWRVLATATTFLISWLVTGSVAMGAGIATIEFWAKLVLYYGHERAWAKVH